MPFTATTAPPPAIDRPSPNVATLISRVLSPLIETTPPDPIANDLTLSPLTAMT